MVLGSAWLDLSSLHSAYELEIKYSVSACCECFLHTYFMSSLAWPDLFLCLGRRKRVWLPFHRNPVQQNQQIPSSADELLTSRKGAFNDLRIMAQFT